MLVSYGKEFALAQQVFVLKPCRNTLRQNDLEGNVRMLWAMSRIVTQ